MMDVIVIFHFGLFLPFYPLNLPEKWKFFKKWKKHPEISSLYTHQEISSFYTSVPKIMIIYYTVPKIWHMMDVIVIFHFVLFLPNKNFLKNEKNTRRYHHYTHTRRYHHYTQVYQKSWSYTILFLGYGTWCINCHFSFWAIFCPFTPLTCRKMKIWKKYEKNTGRYHHFTQVYQKSWLDDVRFLRYGAQRTDSRQMDRRMDGQMDRKSDI